MTHQRAAQTTVDWFGILNQLSRSINLASQDTAGTLRPLMARLIATVGMDAVAVWTVEPETNFMRIETEEGLSERYVRFFNKTDRIRVGQGLVGRVMRERRTLAIRNLVEYAGIGIPRWNEILREEGLTAILAAPMFVGEKIIGALNVYYKREHDFGEPERLFTEILANHIAVTIENIKNSNLIAEDREQLKRQIAKLLSVQRVTQLMSLRISESLEESLTLLAGYLAEQFRTTGLAVFEHREGDALLTLTAAAGMPQRYADAMRHHPPRFGPGTLVGVSCAERAPLVSSRVMSDPRIEKWERVFLSIEGDIAMGAFPLLVRDRAIGSLAVYYHHRHEFSDEEVGILNTFAQFLGILIDNIHIFQSLVAEKQNTQAMVASLSDGIIVYDLEGNVIEANPRSEELLFLRREDAVGWRPGRESRDPGVRNLAAISSLLLEDFGAKEIAFTEPVNVVLRVTQLPLRTEKTKIGSMRVLHDITAEKAVEALKSSFVSTASHQLRSPLTGIKWGLHALLTVEEGPLEPTQRALVGKVLGVTDTLIALVNDLLDVSRIEEGRFGYTFAPGDIRELVEEVRRDLELAVKQRRLTMTVDAPARLPPASFDRAKLGIAIRNILDNAVKYTLPDGRVTVRLRAGQATLLVSIEDTGIGIPKDDQAFLFNKFFRAKNAVRLQTQGSGLGLYIAKHIVERHNGKISVDSTENLGSTFVIQLPLQPEMMPRGAIPGF